jgi:hypothetical protein
MKKLSCECGRATIYFRIDCTPHVTVCTFDSLEIPSLKRDAIREIVDVHLLMRSANKNTNTLVTGFGDMGTAVIIPSIAFSLVGKY